MTNYADAGVDIDAGNRAVKLMGDAVRSTNTPAVLSELGAFGGLFSTAGLGDGSVLVASTDGVGTKVELAARHGGWNGVGRDLVNHCVDDILVQGARPLFFLDYIATAKLVPEIVAEIVTGMAEACKEVGCALLGGETAEMPGVYTEGSVDIAGTIVGAVHRDALWPRTDDLRPGDVLLGMASDSPHTNGYSLIRLLLDRHDDDPSDDLIEWLLTPHKSYLGEVDELRALGVEPKALAHITGGGFFEKIPRVLPDSIGAEIQLGTWDVPAGFRHLVELGDVPDSESFRTWNMGMGLIVAIDADDAEAASASGHPVIGRLVESDTGEVELVGDWRWPRVSSSWRRGPAPTCRPSSMPAPSAGSRPRLCSSWSTVALRTPRSGPPPPECHPCTGRWARSGRPSPTILAEPANTTTLRWRRRSPTPAPT